MKVHEQVQEYYGSKLQTNQDLKTTACCDVSARSPRIKKILSEINTEILEKSYGCGSPIPSAIEDCSVLDLGCGTGRDVYLASKLVGEKGYVLGVDMTDEQLQTAISHIDSQMEKFGFNAPNVHFEKGYLEDLNKIGLADNSFDVAISNCVLNLTADKKKAFSEIFRVLKPGGELYFSDVFSDRRIPSQLKDDPTLYGECLSGALYIEDFRRILNELGCKDYRIVETSPIEIESPEVYEKIGMVNFASMTIRAFKIPALEDICEDYGQIATYKGNILDSPHFFDLDGGHRFFTNKPAPVCGNTALMLQETRFKSHFEVLGDTSNHYGVFQDCGPLGEPETKASDSGSCC